MYKSSTVTLEEIKQNVAQAVQRQRAIREGRKAYHGDPPASNTGGKSTGTESVAQVGACHVDTFSFTLPMDALGGLQRPDDGTLASLVDFDALLVVQDAESIAARVEDIFLHTLGFYVGQSTGKRPNGYHDSAPIRAYAHSEQDAKASNLGFVAWGGNRNKDGQETMQVNFTGEACESINCQDAMQGGDIWASLVSVLTEFQVKITRIDFAYDDLDGHQGGVGDAVRWYRQGLFCAGGRPPSVSMVGDWINGKSRTLYVGKRANGKLIRIYEKGHQLGDDSHPWTRYELELRSTDRHLSPVMLLQSDSILAGSYPCMSWVADVVPISVPTIVKERLTVTLDHLTDCARIAYGRLVNVMQGLGTAPGDILDSLRVDGMPRRLRLPPSLYGPPVVA